MEYFSEMNKVRKGVKQNPDTKDLLALDGKDWRPDTNYDNAQLVKGIEVEMEHTNNRDVAKVIAKDHLDEKKEYYEILSREGL